LAVIGCLACGVFGSSRKVHPTSHRPEQTVTEETRLIEFGPGERKWMTRSQIDALMAQGKKNNFIDVTDTPVLPQPSSVEAFTMALPTQPVHQYVVDPLLPHLKSAEIAKTITQLSSYHTRYYTTQTGLQAAQWILNKYKEIAGNRDYVEINFFQNSFLQPSVIARIKGTNPNIPGGIVILGGHEDSTAGGALARSPGADDDASGSSCVLEVFRVLMENNFRPLRDVEFHAYAAEEAGLLGSQAIARDYQTKGKQVFGMMQLDMTGYTPPGRTPVVGLIEDFVNATLTRFVGTLINEYANIGFSPSRCGYGCSDHASWTRFGYPASFPFETTFNSLNPHIHTAQDTLDKLSMEHAVEFAKIGLSFVVEMGLTGN